LVAHPRADRWHRRATATVGGIGVFVAFWAGMAVFQPEVSRPYPMLFAASLLFAAGLLDDVVQLRPLTKLLAQLAAAGIVVTVGARLQLPWTAWPLLNAAITVVWLVGITNAFNLLDNMDGLAGGIAAIGAVFLTVTFVLNGQTPQGELAMILCGAVAGFLVFNVNPASIFMGDCGSMFLGFALAGMALLSQYGRSRNLGAVVIAPVIILMVPILDTCLVTITRKVAGRPVSVGGRDHSSHRLVALGNSERRAVVILWSIAAVAGTLALLVRGLSNSVAIAVLGGVATAMALFGVYLARVPVERRASAAARPESRAHGDHVDAPAGAVRAV
jgi:UDP-GlcNAc:undecaprenyl-phosphate GlcNAc-1-phosphate transferase